MTGVRSVVGRYGLSVWLRSTNLEQVVQIVRACDIAASVKSASESPFLEVMHGPG